MLALTNFGVIMVFYLLLSTMAVFVTREFDASGPQAGLAASIYFIGALISRFPAGWIVVRLGPRRATVISLAVFALAVAAYLPASSLTAVLVVRLVHGFVFGFAQTAVSGTVLQILPPARRSEGYGWFTAGLAIGTGLAPAVGLPLLAARGMSAVLLLSVGCAVFAAACALVAAPRLPGVPAPTPSAPGRRRISLSTFFEPRVLGISTVVGCAACAFSTVLSFLATSLDGGPLAGLAGVYFLVYAAVTLVARPGAGILQDRLGERVVIAPAMLLVALGAVLTAWSPSGAVLLLGGAILGLGYGTVVPAGQTSAVHRLGAHRSAIVVSSFFLVVDTGTGVAPVLLGGLIPHWGHAGAFYVAGGIALAGLTLYLLLDLRSRRRALP